MTKEQLEQELTEARAKYDLHVKSRPNLYNEYQYHCKVQQCLKEAEDTLQKLFWIHVPLNPKSEAIKNIRIDLWNQIDPWNQFENIRLLVQERSVLLSKIAQLKKQLKALSDEDSNDN